MLDHVGGEHDVVEDADRRGDGEPEGHDAGAEAERAPEGELLWAKGVTATPAAQIKEKSQDGDDCEKRPERPSMKDGVACTREWELVAVWREWRRDRICRQSY